MCKKCDIYQKTNFTQRNTDSNWFYYYRISKLKAKAKLIVCHEPTKSYDFVAVPLHCNSILGFNLKAKALSDIMADGLSKQ